MKTINESITDSLDPEVCRRARLSRDTRFDGEFYLGVSTTGIYCRPICPARNPRESNVTYYRSAAQAAQAGYRPCMRCRPESAPGSPAWQGSRTTVNRALKLIQQGALNTGSSAALAARLGVGERYLRKLFERELGVSPRVVAQTERLLFAKKLLTETELSITDIAFASGFGSTRRFNSFILEQMRCTPSSLRRKRQTQGAAGDGVRVELQLKYRPPLDWAGMLYYFDRHAVPAIESASNECYRRSFTLEKESGWFCARNDAASQALNVEVHVSSANILMAVVERLRAVFDLNASPQKICGHFDTDPAMADLADRFPGTRSLVAWSPFEAAVRAVIGQQVSLAGASTVLNQIIQRCGRATEFSDGPNHFFPTPAQMLDLAEEPLPMPGRRRTTLFKVCEYYNSTECTDADQPWQQLLSLPGIGPWTSDMIAMRGYGQPNVFPASDLVLLKAANALGLPGKMRALEEHATRWQPWRAYAANLLWRSYSP
ncbi:MAG: AraC family transcriptional regulator of adaptative response / DNA-3-methyladenine glycosylase II [Halieaceae bacterium]|jgi:AraC family transcriptional regulator of adaptative response / DNA-3-methyladenine glycosylase II